jgi:dolichol-phosphate mannosyltransferase
MGEENRYYRGMVAWVGFKQIGFEYERDRRYAGASTFSMRKYFNFAVNGLTSFTDKPLYFSSYIGLVITIVSFIFLTILVVNKILDPSYSIPGWSSVITALLFFGGIQLISIGLVSIYISKIYIEVKKRPLYIIESTENLDQSN